MFIKKGRLISYGILLLIITVYSFVFITKMFQLSVDISGQKYFVISDDAFISMRYANNLALGYGLVWNAGERVEGYTNFLWVIWMYLLHLLPIAKNIIPGILQLSILAFNIITFFILRLLASKFFQSKEGGLLEEKNNRYLPLIENIPVFLLAFTTTFIANALNGLETTFLAMALLGLVYSFYQLFTDGGQRYYFYIIFWQTIGVLTRDDFVLVSLVAGAFFWLLKMDEISLAGLKKSLSKRNIKIFLLLFAIPALAKISHLGFRFYYYNEFLPNTYYQKLLGWDTVHKLLSGSKYLIKFIWGFPLFLTVIAVFLWRLLKRFSRSLSVFDKLIYFLVAIVLVNTIYFFNAGGDLIGENRFFVPIYSLLYLLFVVAIFYFIAKYKIVLNLFTLVIFSLAILTVTPYFIRFKDGWSAVGIHDQSNIAWGIIYAKYLKEKDSQAKIAVYHAGSFPYWSEMYSVDMLGLNEKHIARTVYRGARVSPGHSKYDYDYVFAKYNPDYIINGDEPENFTPQDADKMLKLAEVSGYPFGPGLFGNQTFLKKYYPNKFVLPSDFYEVAGNFGGYMPVLYKRGR